MNFRYNHDFENGEFIKYMVLDELSGQYYCGSGIFSSNINKAKTYYRLCDAKNAINYYGTNSKIKLKLVVQEYIISQKVEHSRTLWHLVFTGLKSELSLS